MAIAFDVLRESGWHSSCLSTFSCLEPAGYIGEFEIVDDHRSGKVVIDLIGRINKCGVISPRFDLKLAQIEQWTSNLLPSRQFGYVVLTTSLGIMDHEEVRRFPISCNLCRSRCKLTCTCAWQEGLMWKCVHARLVKNHHQGRFDLPQIVCGTYSFVCAAYHILPATKPLSSVSSSARMLSHTSL